MRPAVFLDRDGTMVHDANYLRQIDQLRWFPYTVDAVRLWNRAGYVVCVTTNQGGIGLGLLTEEFLQRVHDDMDAKFARGGAHIDGWFHCPHHPRALSEGLRAACDCRKPGPGMIRQAAARFGIDVARSFVIGDKLADLGMAANAGALAILVRTGTGEDAIRESGGQVRAAYVAADLMDATAWALSRRERMNTTS
jgi:D-glycero-D-manno-heptose 1,7-bisphosphate phosphatase